MFGISGAESSSLASSKSVIRQTMSICYREAAMKEHSLQTSTAEKMQTTSVADYIVQRIVDEGVAHCFGVAGDYLFPMCNAIESSQKVKWIGCANELNAAYAADGYAR